MFSTINRAVTIFNDSIIYKQTKSAPNLHYRFVFRTQSEAISVHWCERFYKFVACYVRAAGADVVFVGGTTQCVKIRVRLHSTFSPDEFAQRLKILSANWVRRKAHNPDFAWREDYEAITLDPNRIEYSEISANRD